MISIMIQLKKIHLNFFNLKETATAVRKRLALESQEQQNQQGASSSSGGDGGADHVLGKNQNSASIGDKSSKAK